MTISSTNSRWEYTGNGATTAFAYDNLIFDDSDLKVYVAGTLKTLTTDYTVSGAGGTSGGNVTFGSAPASGASVVIVRDVPATQPQDYEYRGSVSAEGLERALDRATVLIQQLKTLIARSLVLPDATTFSGDLELPSPSASTLLGWNAAGDGLSNYTPNTDTYVDSDALALLDALLASLSGNGLSMLRVNAGGTALETRTPAEVALDVVGLTSEITIASGVATPTATSHTVDTESDAASDDLDLIDATNLGDGALLFLAAQDGARTVVVKHDSGSPTGNQKKIYLADDSDFSLDDAEKWLLLKRRGDAWQEVCRSSGAASAWTFVSPISASGGANVDFTSLPAGVREAYILIDGLSHNAGGAGMTVQLGDSGGFETSGYSGGFYPAGGSHQAFSNGFDFASSSTTAASSMHALIHLVHETGNTWFAAGHSAKVGSDVGHLMGVKQISAELDRIRVATGGTYDAGTVAILYRVGT